MVAQSLLIAILMHYERVRPTPAMHGAGQPRSQVGMLEGADARAGEGGREEMGPRSHQPLSLPCVPSEPE